jgi:DNA polymerase I
MPTLYLIDGLGQFFRSYHAIRTPMTSPVTKEPTNMSFGFVGMLLKLLRAEGTNLKAAGAPDYVAVAMDVSGDRGTFRSQLYPEYKAHRDPPPEDLWPQVERCVAMLREIGIPVIGAEGFEADDVMATIVERLGHDRPDVAIRLVSKDKDLKQLLSPLRRDDQATGRGDVMLFDVHTDTPFSTATLEAETGLRPDQIVDMLTLMGDTVDNVPGVEGVGEKTAALLLREHGSLDNLLSHASEIKGKRGEKLREAMPRLGLSKELVTLRRDVDTDFALDAASVAELRLDKLLPILKELGFNRYQEEVKTLLRSRGELTSDLPGEHSNAQPAGAAANSRTVAPAPQASRKNQKAEPSEPGGFGGLFDSVGAAHASDAPRRTAESGDYRCVRTREELDEVAHAMRTATNVALDTETTSLSFLDADLCGVSVCVEAGRAWYIPTRSPTPDSHLDTTTVLSVLGPILANPTRTICGHNLKYDLLVLRRHGVEVAGTSKPGSCDTMVASYLIDASRSSHSMDALAMALLNRTNISITELIGSGKHQRTFDTVPLDLATEYAAEDADVTMRLRDAMQPQLTSMGLSDLMERVEMPLVEVLAELEFNGIRVDPAELERQRARLQSRIDGILLQIKRECIEALGRSIDPDSPKQLAAALFNSPDHDDVPGLGIKATKKTKTGFSTDAEVLDELTQDPSVTTSLPALVLEYRQLSKLVSTYLVALKEAIHPRTGRVHASFNQTVAATGRLSSSDPNLQNIPIRTEVGREIRRAFVAPPGRVLVTADYSQIELRLLAHLARDPALIEAFKQGADIHTAVAAQIHGIEPAAVTKDQRAGAKMVNFGIVYGITSFGLARRLKIEERAAQEIITGYKKRFAGITTFLQECVEQARRDGFVTTMLGRRRPIPDVDSNQPSRRALAERLAINSVVQGSAADLIKLAMVDLHQRIRTARGHAEDPLDGTLMLLQIHDELVFECPRERADAVMSLVVGRMEAAMALSVPLKADAGWSESWFDG